MKHPVTQQQEKQRQAIAPASLSALHNSTQPLGQAHLRFQLTDTMTAAFSMKDINEVLVVPAAQLTPMFNMPACVSGLLTRRSRILWTVDLADLLLGEPLGKAHAAHGANVAPGQAGKCSIVIVRVNTRALLGLIVQQIRGYIQIAEDAVLPIEEATSAEVTPVLRPYVKGRVPANGNTDETDLLLLEVSAIAQQLQHKAAKLAQPKAQPEAQPKGQPGPTRPDT